MQTGDVFIWDMPTGNRVLHIVDTVHPDGSEEGTDIELAALATFRELLGYAEIAECLEALRVIAKAGVPPVDPETRESVFTPIYELLMRREQAREDAAEQAAKDGEEHQRVVLRSAEAAYAAVHIPIDGGECELDKARRAARKVIGVPHPESRCGIETRTTAPRIPAPVAATLSTVGSASGGDQISTKVLEAIQGREDELLGYTQRFLHRLSDHSTDHLSGIPGEGSP